MAARSRSAFIMGVAALTAGWLAGTPASAQSQTTPASAAKSDASDTVTIFAKRRPQSVREFSQISARSARSCSYQTADGAAEQVLDDYLGGFGYDDGTRTMDPPSFVRVHGEGTDLSPSALSDPKTGAAVTDPSALRPRINDRAIYGDVSQTTGNEGFVDPIGFGNDINPSNTGGASGFNNVASTPGGCTTADAAESAGRNFIARNDTTFRDGMAAFEAKDYPKALSLFQRNYSKLGYPESAMMIAQIYLGGLGVPPDPGKAIAWLKKVAESPAPDFADRQRFDPADPYAIDGRNEAIMMLARLYVTGAPGVPQNAKEARKWFMAADEGGYVPAAHHVGLIFEAGYGGEKNQRRAATCFQRAGEAGFAPSQYHLGQLYYDGADDIPQDKTKAGAWLLLAAKAGYPPALYAVGRMYELGEGGAAADQPKALAFYKAAAVKGQIDAQVTLATYFYTGGGGVTKDLDVARKLFQAAAAQGDPDAMFNLAVMMANGEGGPKDVVKAYCWFSVAQKGGVEKAGAALQELSGKMTADERAQADALLNPHAGK